MKGLGFVIAAAFLWALDGLIRYPLVGTGLASEVIVFYEHLILCGIFALLFFKNIKALLGLPLNHIFLFILLGAFGSALATVAFTEAFRLINPSLVILLQKFQPIIAVLLARAFLKENISVQFIGWSVACLVGVILISYQDLASGVAKLNWQTLWSVNAFKGYMLTITAAIGWASATVIGKKLSMLGHSEKQIMSGRYVFALMALTPIVLMRSESIAVNQDQLIKLLVLVCLSGLLAMYLYYHGLKLISARVCTLGELFFPLGAVILNWLVLDITISFLQVLGGVLLMLGATMIQLKRY